MSQLQGVLATTQLPAASSPTRVDASGLRFSWMPSRAALDRSWFISSALQAASEAYGKVNCRPCPCLIPGPHRLGAVHVLTPSGMTFQPWLVSSALALAGL